MKPLITVVMAVFNGAELVRPAIASILQQTLEPFELLVVDDGSTDGSGDVIAEQVAAYPTGEGFSFRLVRHPANLGYGAVTNTGLQCAAGDWITFVDADDTIEPEYLERMLAAGRAHEAELVVPRMRAIDEAGHSTMMRQWMPQELVSTGADAMRRSVRGELVESQHVLIARSLWEQCASRTDNAYSDLIFLLQLFGQCRQVAYLDQSLYNYSIRSGSVTGSLRPSVWDLTRVHDYIRPVIKAVFEPDEAATLNRHFHLQMLWQLLQKAASEPTASQLRADVTSWVRRRIRVSDVVWLAKQRQVALAVSFALAKMSPEMHRKAYEGYTRLKHASA
ncbi:glycosyltransferase family 2 protein [Arthrobacter pigmenti]